MHRRAGHGLGNPDGLANKLDIQPAPAKAPPQMDFVDLDPTHRHVRGLSGHGHGRLAVLGRCPDVNPFLRIQRRAVLGFHGGVLKIRSIIVGFDCCGRAGKCAVDIALMA